MKENIIEYQEGNCYEFPIVKFNSFLNKKGERVYLAYVKTIDGTIISVKVLEWHNEKIWKYGALNCEVKGFEPTGLPKLINKDFRHPLYTVGKQYEFTIIGNKIKTNTTSGVEYKVFELLGEDNCKHDVNIIPGQTVLEKSGTKVTCEVVSIFKIVRLKQLQVEDPFFVEIEKVIPDKELINKYFKVLFENNENDIYAHKLIEQYNSKSAFWIFTFCNKLLPEVLKNIILRFDYKSAEEVNYLMLKCEEWIVNKGIIRSFTNESLKKKTKAKAEQEIERCEIINRALNHLQSYSLNFHSKLVRFDEIYFIFCFSDLSTMNEIPLIQRIENELLREDFDSKENYYLNVFEEQISIKKKMFLNPTNKTFNLDNSYPQFKNVDFQNKYFNWSYCQYILNVKSGNTQKGNLLLGRILRHYFYVVEDFNLKEKILFNSFFILNNSLNKNIISPLKFSNHLEIDWIQLHNNPNTADENYEVWEQIIQAYNNKTNIVVNVYRKVSEGCIIKFNGLEGFLPSNFITDRELKNYRVDEIDYTITVYIISISKEFNVFVVQQLNTDDLNYISENNFKEIKLTKGAVIEGIIKGIQDYGVFVTTKYGDGLLHINKISNHSWSFSRLNKHFKKDEKIKCVATNDSSDNRINLSLIDLFYTDYSTEYEIFLDKVDLDDLNQVESEIDATELTKEEPSFDVNSFIQLEKALCFEQYALLQINLNLKIQSLQLAKQFFSTIGNARSYLINIYTDYFQVLILLKETIKSYSQDRFQIVKNEVEKIKTRIDHKTIETFPDSEKLIYFLDIISLFNEKNDEKNAKLYEYIEKYSREKNKETLKTIAKITLSNNLMVSETEDASDFSLKNLKHINSFLENGVFSLKESESDRLQRELNEKIKYWRDKILENESQTLEFKATFLTPVLDSKKQKQLEILQNLPVKSEDAKRKIDFIKGDPAVKRIMHSSLKTLAAFANSSGGTLLIGVTDDKQITGLEIDYNFLEQKDRDGFGKRFDDAIKTYFGESFSTLLHREFLNFPEGDVLVITVDRSHEEIFIFKDDEGENTEDLYIRQLSSSELLKGSELAKFIKKKLREQLKLI